jgi:ankyrin repeat protein
MPETVLRSNCRRQLQVLVLEQLLEGGIDVNAVNWKGQPALYFACARGDGAAAKMLLSKGADVDAAFHIARCSESPAIKVLWRAYPLHHAGSNGRLQDVEGFLREGNVDVNASDHKGRMPLHEASRKGHLHVLRALLPTRIFMRLSPAAVQGFRKTVSELASCTSCSFSACIFCFL